MGLPRMNAAAGGLCFLFIDFLQFRYRSIQNRGELTGYVLFGPEARGCTMICENDQDFSIVIFPLIKAGIIFLPISREKFQMIFLRQSSPKAIGKLCCLYYDCIRLQSIKFAQENFRAILSHITGVGQTAGLFRIGLRYKGTFI